MRDVADMYIFLVKSVILMNKRNKKPHQIHNKLTQK